MNKLQLKATKQYLKSLTAIEDFIFQETQNIKVLESFLSEHERVQQFIEQNPDTPAPHPNTGDQSWPFGNGRYRVFFKVVPNQKTIYFLDIIDNRMLNKSTYPNNSMPTYKLDH